MGRLLALLLALSALGYTPAAPAPGASLEEPEITAPQDAADLRARAEAKVAEGSHGLALRLYRELAQLELEDSERAWVDYRLADLGWREVAASADPDPSRFDAARMVLDDFIARYERPEERDDLWAFAQESKGDLNWSYVNRRNQNLAFAAYQAALDHWAASPDLERARVRYLAIVWNALAPPQSNGWQRRNWVQNVDESWLLGARAIAVTQEHRARAAYYVAKRGERDGSNERRHTRTREAFQEVLELGAGTSVYADALYDYGVWLEERGALQVDSERGTWSEADYVAAIVIYRRLVEEYGEGTHEHWRDARNRIKKILGEEVSLGVGQVFLPGSAVGFGLRWRNVDSVALSLHAVDLVTAVELRSKTQGSGEYIDSVDLGRYPAAQRWNFATKDDGAHRWGYSLESLDFEVAPGAYVLEARAGDARSRQLVLVSDAALVVKSESGRVVAWFADARTGEPIAGAPLKLWYKTNHDAPWRSVPLETDADGLAEHRLGTRENQRDQYFLAAGTGARQAFAITSEPWSYRRGNDWRIFAQADRAAYRPGQTVSWRFTAREHEGGVYATPAGQALHWELAGPNGDISEKGDATLNEFGTAAGTFQPDEAWSLGEYRLQFYHVGRGKDERGGYLGDGTLFRLEEYKLPEFQVRVERQRDADDAPVEYRTGDVAEITIQADYYFGGAVANATVEAVVYRKPFQKSFHEPRQFPWFYTPDNNYGGWWGNGEEVLRQTLRTDAEGRAVVRIETDRADGQDYEFTVEARVVDSSRREVSGQGSVRVTRQGWFAHLGVDHQLVAPGGEAELTLSASNADDDPMQVEGEVSLVRMRWREIWRRPDGTTLRGRELAALRSQLSLFPPAPRPEQLPWRRLEAEYEETVVATTVLATDTAGQATWRVKPPSVGHYKLRFSGRDSHGAAIHAETGLSCVEPGTTDLAIQTDGTRLVLDKDTFREGELASILITTPASGRWVLFAVESNTLLEHRVVHVTGTVKLLQLEVTESWVPDVHLAVTGLDQGLRSDDLHEIIVPPLEHFLDLELTLDPETALPGSEGTLQITARDANGEPVAAEVSLALVDASLAAIQGEYAGDPRQFFFGDKRGHAVATMSTMNTLPYRRLVVTEDGELVEERYAWADSSGEEEELDGADSAVMGELASLGYAGGLVEKEVRASASADFRASTRSRRSGDLFLADSIEGSMAPPASAAPTEPASGTGAVTVRSDFRETALWLPSAITDADGRAEVRFTYPENLTRWSASARARTRGADFGITRGESATRLPLLARIQAPRFFVEGDEVVISVNVDNRTDEKLTARVELSVEGLEVIGAPLQLGQPPSATIDAQGGARLDWRVRATKAGTARFVAKVTSGEYGDGVELSLPVVRHGIEALEAKAGRFDGEGVDLTLDLPARDEGTELVVQVTPSHAVTMLDALPYLVDYPYGCTEQTLSRFLPTTIVARTLERLGLDPAVALNRVYGGIEAEYAGKTQRETNAGLRDLARATSSGLERLYDLQHGDGSWSWWKEGDGDQFMTAYVVWGLALARDAEVDVDRSKLDAGGEWLGRVLVEAEDDLALQAWMLHAHTAWLGDARGEQRGFAEAAAKNLYAQRRGLNAYGRALLLLSVNSLGQDDEARVLANNLIDGVLRDDAPDASIVPVGGAAGGTQSPRAHWGEDGVGYRWSDGGVEATAFALRALVAFDPKHELVEPVADWLISNRRGAQWSNTKTTAICVLALCDYLEASGQLDREVGFTVTVNGTEVGSAQLAKNELLTGPSLFSVPAELIQDGPNRVAIRRTAGEGPLYFLATARFFSREEPVVPRGNELFVRRQYYKLEPRPTLLRGSIEERVLMQDGDVVTSGQRIEVVLTVETKNHLEYLLFEDLKPAGFEATQVKSGEPIYARELRRDEVALRLGGDEAKSGRGARRFGERFDVGYTGRQRWMHQELRDRKVAFFLDRCPEGVWEIRYELRAEAPGAFHALPLLGEAMYVPEIRANGAELRLTVKDREDV